MSTHTINLTFQDIRQHVEKCPVVLTSTNKTNYDQSNSGESGWFGDSYADSVRQLNSGIDNFDAWINALDRALQVPVTVRRRKRKLNDVDGDVEFDRRWDDRPFEAIYKQRVQTPVINLYVKSNFNGGVGSAEILKYGMNIYKLINALEQTGHAVNLFLYYNSVGCYDNRDTQLLYVEIKKSGEYLEPSILATTLTPFFYRRFIFQEYCIQAQLSGHNVSYGLGSADPLHGRSFTIDDNNVYIEPQDPSTFNAKEFETTLNQILESLV